MLCAAAFATMLPAHDAVAAMPGNSGIDASASASASASAATAANASASASSGSGANADAPPVVRPLADWPALRDLNGATIDPRNWRGVPTVVVFWATWCEFCRRHNPRIDALHRSIDERRLRVIGVAVDGPADKVRRHVAEAGYRFPIVLDTAGLRARFSSRRIVPMTCTVDAGGRLLQCLPGEMSEADVLDLARLALPAGS